MIKDLNVREIKFIPELQQSHLVLVLLPFYGEVLIS